MSFDRIARHYRLLETVTFGRALQRARTYWVDKIPRPKRALILGEGNGRFLCQFLRAFPKIDVDCLDESAVMLELTRRRINDSCRDSFDRVRLIHDDLRRWAPQYSYDLIVTHFFLDCFQSNELKGIVDKIAGASTPNARWLLADFTIPDSGILPRANAKLWLRTMYCFFQAITAISATELVDPSPYIEANKFICAFRKISRAGMIKSELWQRHL